RHRAPSLSVPRPTRPPDVRRAPAAHQRLHSFPTRRSSDLASSSASPMAASRSTTPDASPPARRPDQAGSLSRLPNLLVSVGTYQDRKSTRLNSSHVKMSYAVFCLKKKTKQPLPTRFGRRKP